MIIATGITKLGPGKYMKRKPMIKFSFALNIFAVVFCTITMFINLYSGLWIWALIQGLLAFINGTFAVEAYRRIRAERIDG